MKKSILAIGFILILLCVVLIGCFDSESEIDNDDSSDVETIKVKILDTTLDTGDGSDEYHTNFYQTIKIYNEGASGYAIIHFDLYEGSFQDYSYIYQKEEVVHLDAGEYKEITFIFNDMKLGQSYSPDAWVEYD